MSKEENDPIARKLKDHVIYYTESAMQKIRRKKGMSNQEYIPLQIRNARDASEHELAQYETLEFADDQNEEVLEFIRYLGYEPATLEKAIITIEVGKPVMVEVKGYSAVRVSAGSLWSGAPSGQV